LRKPGKRRHGERKTAVFNRSDGLNMDARQFSKALLSQASPEPSLTDVPSEQTQDFAVVHSR
jgi:hypothetical protein